MNISSKIAESDKYKMKKKKKWKKKLPLIHNNHYKKNNVK